MSANDLETTYINEWVETGAYELTVGTPAAAQLRRLGVDLLDVNFVLRTGRVVRSDMLDQRGLWDVVGTNVDGILVEIQIAVVSATCEVELLRIGKL